MKNKIIFLIEFIIFCAVIYFAAVNYASRTTAGFNITAASNSYVVLNTFFIIISAYLAGLISGSVHSFLIGSKYREQLEFYARKNEKLAVQNEIDTDDREALQRKIASLEIALDNALKNKG